MLVRGHHTHGSSICVALGMAVVLPHLDRTFPRRGIRQSGSRWWRPLSRPIRHGVGAGGGGMLQEAGAMTTSSQMHPISSTNEMGCHMDYAVWP